jgi:hypothetical protein
VYVFEKDYDHNFVPFSSSNFFVFPQLKEFLDKNDYLNLNLIPDPAESFFGFYFTEKPNSLKPKQIEQQIQNLSKSMNDNYFTYDM